MGPGPDPAGIIRTLCTYVKKKRERERDWPGVLCALIIMCTDGRKNWC